jgi:prepilin peptidase CpaA
MFEWVLRPEMTPPWVSGTSQVAFVDTVNVLFLLVLGICGGTDIFAHRIYNFVTYPAMVTGIVLNTLGSGWRGLQMSVIGLVVGFVMFFIVFLFGGLGGGDVKLMAAVGALQGYPFIMYASAFSALFGALIAVGALMARGRLWRSLRNVFGVMLSYAVPFMEKRHLDPKESFPIPYGYAMAMGSLWAWFLTAAGTLRF